jgi:hypothetical protein
MFHIYSLKTENLLRTNSNMWDLRFSQCDHWPGSTCGPLKCLFYDASVCTNFHVLTNGTEQVGLPMSWHYTEMS